MSKKHHIFFFVVTFLYWFSLYIYIPILAPYMESLGASYTYIGIIIASYGFMQILIRVPLGILSDYINVRRLFIVIAMIAGGISCFGFALTESLGWSLVFRSVAGVSGSIWIIFTVLYSSYFAKNRATKAMGTIQFITVTAQLSSLALSGILTSQWGWHAPFWLGGVTAVIGLCFAFLLVDPNKDTSSEKITTKDLTSVIRTSILLKASFLAFVVHSILFVTMYGFAPTYAVNMGASKSDLSLLVFAFMIPHAAASILVGKFFVPKFGEWMTLTIGFLGSAVFTAVIPFINEFGWFCLSQSFNGFSQGLIIPLLMGMAIQTIEHKKRTTAMGFYQAAVAVGMFFGPYLAGWLASNVGLSGGFQFAGLLGFLAVFLCVFWNKREEHVAISKERE
jgi:DHA1 family multidrug resistance protein-like MFS transporter